MRTSEGNNGKEDNLKTNIDDSANEDEKLLNQGS
jgi:hypothetical protein